MKNFIQNTINSQKVFYRYFRRKGWKRFLKENILESEGSNLTKAKSIALGVFVGLTPLFGFHTVAVVALASYFKLNKVLSYMCTHVSFPPFIPFLIMISLMIGAPFVNDHTNFSNLEFNKELIKAHLVQYLVGSMILATVSAALTGISSYFILQKIRPDKNIQSDL